MQHLFTFLQYKGYNKNPLWARIIVECIKIYAAWLSRLLQEQQFPVLLPEERRLAVLPVLRRSEEELVFVLVCYPRYSPWGCRNGGRRSDGWWGYELQAHWFLNSLVLPAPHRRRVQERAAPAKQGENYAFELQFGVVGLLNISTFSNPEEGSKHTDIWTFFLFRTSWTNWRSCCPP